MKFIVNKDRYFIVFAFLLFASVSFFIYGNTLNNPFVDDDIAIVRDNSLLESFSSVGDFFNGEIDSKRMFAGTYRPLTMLTFVLNKKTGGSSPVSYRVINIFLHSLNAFLFMLLFWNLFSLFGVSEEVSKIAAFLVGFLFLCHPVQAHTVNMIWKRTTLMASLFMLLAVLFYIYFLRLGKVLHLLLSMLFILLSLLCKESAYILPLLLAVIYFVCRRRRVAFNSRIRSRSYLFLCAVLILCILFYVLSFSLRVLPSRDAWNVTEVLSPLNYFLIQVGEVIPRYLLIMFTGTGMSFHHSIVGVSSFFHIVRGIGILCVVLLVAFWALKRGYGVCAVGLFSFLIVLIPTSSFHPLSLVMDDSRLYFSLGFFLAALIGLAVRIVGTFKKGVGVVFLILLFFIVGCVWGLSTHAGNRLWKDERLLWLDVYKKYPKSVRVLGKLAFLCNERGEYSDAVRFASKAVDILPTYFLGYQELGIALYSLGRREEAGKVFKKMLELLPRSFAANYNMAVYLMNEGRYKEALFYIRRAVLLDPLNRAGRALLKRIEGIPFKKGRSVR